MNRPRRADLIGVGVVAAFVVAACAVVALTLAAPLVLLSILAVGLLVYAGHVLGDELEARVDRWLKRGTPPTDPAQEGARHAR